MHSRRELIGLAVCLALAIVSGAAAPAAGQSAPPTMTRLELADRDRLLFLGDSITHQCLYTQYVEDYFLTRYPDRAIEFRNAGVSGDKAGDALVRFDQDVSAFKPTHVTVLLGMNDGSYQHFNHEVFSTYERDMGILMDRLTGLGAKVIAMGPSLFDSRVAATNPPRWIQGQNVEPMKKYYNAVLGFYSAWLREEAERRGLGYVDLLGPMANLTFAAREADPKFTLIADAVHPGPAGQAVMAAAILEQMHAEPLVWSAAAEWSNGDWHVIVERAQTVEASGDEASLRVTIKPLSLPWALPGEASQGYELYGAGAKLSRMNLRASGLGAGKYSLKVNGQEIGVLESTTLADGVDLNDYPNTPMHAQARRVADINKNRNETAVKKLRDAWLQRREKDRQRLAGADTATEVWKKWEADFTKTVAEAEAAAAAMLAEARAAAKPEPLRIEIKRAP